MVLNKIDKKYDVIVIGAGIGGLTCGCYLAKAGLKVLIIEKHDKPGGYCTSFDREGYRFDVAVHYFGSCRKEGVLRRIIRELSLEKELKFNRIDPCDKIILPEHTIFVRKNYEQTLDSLTKAFYKERVNLNNFFNFILQKSVHNLFVKTANYSFADLLDSFFGDYKLKAALSVLLGNIGLPASKASALTSAILYREYICDPGYYPVGGVQVFPDLLAKRLLSYKGDLRLSREVTDIVCKGGKARGVKLDDGTFIASRFVVSNADATLTFRKLLNINNNRIDSRLKKLNVSLSAFACYLGLDRDLGNIMKDHCTTWYFKTYDIESCYDRPVNLPSDSKFKYVICTFPSFHSKNVAPSGKSTMGIIVGVKALRRKLWLQNKYQFAEKLVKRASDIVPGLSKYIDVLSVATPYDFHKFTYNRDGAMYGWAALRNQVKRSVFPQKTPIKNLFLTGHWATGGVAQSGIPVVALSGKNAARLILSNGKKRYTGRN